MAVVFIASDFRDNYVTKSLPELLKNAGHAPQTIHPLQNIATAVQSACIAMGGIDVGVLVHSTEESTGTDSPYRVAKEIRSLSDTLSFRNAVKGKSLPLLVVSKELGNKLSATEQEKLKALDWVSTHDLKPPIAEVPKPILTAINELIFKWRTALLHELECVGYAVILGADGRLSVNPTFKKVEMEGEILHPNADLKALRESGYLIVTADVCRAADSYKELAYLVDNFRPLAKAKKTKPEEVFHSFFKKNPQFLFQESFAKLWSKPRLPDGKGWLEPDFVVKPSVSPQIGAKWKVLDIKLPDVALTRSSRFHPTFSTKLQAALQQVADYRRYFGERDTAKHMLARFGFQPRNPQLAVLIGRKPTPEEADILANAFETTQMVSVDIITYDEVLDDQSLRIEHYLEWLRKLT